MHMPMNHATTKRERDRLIKNLQQLREDLLWAPTVQERTKIRLKRAVVRKALGFNNPPTPALPLKKET